MKFLKSSPACIDNQCKSPIALTINALDYAIEIIEKNIKNLKILDIGDSEKSQIQKLQIITDI